jgi:LAO/AO transport system kinase
MNQCHDWVNPNLRHTCVFFLLSALGAVTRAGPVGAGKSTFVEALGHYILNLSTTHEPPHKQPSFPHADTDIKNATRSNHLWIPHQLAVVCIDPSSYRTGGSILGDKTRMTRLAVHPRAFVRPSPTQGVLGGLAPRTDDVVRLLAQQYPLTIVETVGLGQSELEVKETVDVLILVVPPGGGDQLQGVKKGIVEVADMIVVTKADGDLLAAAKHTASDYRTAMNFLHGVTAHLRDVACETTSKSSPTEVLLASAQNEEGLDVIWQSICKLRQTRMDSGQLETRRREQRRYWMWKTLQTAVLEETEKDPLIRQAADRLLHQLDAGDIPPRVAAAELLQYFIRKS